MSVSDRAPVTSSSPVEAHRPAPEVHAALDAPLDAAGSVPRPGLLTVRLAGSGSPCPDRTPRRTLAVALAVAWLTCPLVEPMPDEDVHYPLWQLPVDLAAVGTIVLAVAALWRGSRHAARLVVAAGCLMAVETITCPWAGHTPVGWWTWVQTGSSLTVTAVGVALYRLGQVPSHPGSISAAGGRPPGARGPRRRRGRP